MSVNECKSISKWLHSDFHSFNSITVNAVGCKLFRAPTSSGFEKPSHELRLAPKGSGQLADNIHELVSRSWEFLTCSKLPQPTHEIMNVTRELF